MPQNNFTKVNKNERDIQSLGYVQSHQLTFIRWSCQALYPRKCTPCLEPGPKRKVRKIQSKLGKQLEALSLGAFIKENIQEAGLLAM